MQSKLEIYISDDCPTCVETKHLAGIIVERYTNVDLHIVNLSNPDVICPDRVFAVPTFVQDDRIIFLGNPSLKELDEQFLTISEP